MRPVTDVSHQNNFKVALASCINKLSSYKLQFKLLGNESFFLLGELIRCSQTYISPLENKPFRRKHEVTEFHKNYIKYDGTSHFVA